MNPRICPVCKGTKTVPCPDGLPTPYICSACGQRGVISVTQDYINGAKARATKEPFHFISEEWTKGYNDMTELLSPIETEIIKLTFKYQTTACGYVRELEESFREEPKAR